MMQIVLFLCLSLALRCMGGRWAHTLPKCPAKCTCSSHFKMVSCEHKNLYEIPASIPDSATELYLGYNILAEINTGSFSTLKNLTQLSLRSNRIVLLENHCFSGLQKLKFLTLRQNKLKAIEKDAFFDLINLHELFLTENHLTSVPDLSFLSNLIYLSVDTNHLESANICSGSANFTKLSTVNLANNLNLTGISAKDFRCVSRSSVRSIDISRCNLQEFDDDVFSFPHLQALKLSYNNISYAMLKHIFSSIAHSDLTSLDLSGVLQPEDFLPRDLFQNLSETKLNHLSLAHTYGVPLILDGTFKYLPYLEYLDMSFSEFSQIKDSSFASMHNLTRIRLDHNRMLLVIPALSSGSLQILDLRNNILLENLKNYAFSGLIHLSTLFLQRCNIRTIHEHTFSGLQNLETLDLSYNAIAGSAFSLKALGAMPNLQVLDLSFNTFGISTEYNVFSGLRKLQWLDFSNNGIKNISSRIFQPLKNLRFLNLARNHLGRMIEMDVEGELFRNLSKLKSLYLDGNKISALPRVLLSSLPDLQVVNLSNNILTSWPEEMFLASTALDMIDLSSNKIATVSELEMSAMPKNTSINMTGNPFACDCDLIWFRRWIESQKNSSAKKLVNLEDYTCNSPDRMAKKPLLEFNPDEIEASCHLLPLTWILVGACSAVFAVVVLATILVYRNRWPLRLHMYYFKRWIKKPSESTLQNADNDFEYDFFVSYGPSDRDRNWVKYQLMPRFQREDENHDPDQQRDYNSTEDSLNDEQLLIPDGQFGEMNSPYTADDQGTPFPILGKWKVFIEEEDATFGRLEFDTIAESIYKSWKIILVVSDEYLSDGRRRAEIDLAVRSRYENGMSLDAIIVLFLESDADVKVPYVLHPIIEGREQLKWVEDDTAGKELFWLQLAEAIKLKPDVAPLVA